jgi:hypothetical protein
MRSTTATHPENDKKINKVSVGPIGSGALSSRFEEKGVWMRKNLLFVGGLAIVVALAAIVG